MLGKPDNRLIRRAMQQHRGARPGLCHGPVAVHRLARLQHAAQREGHRGQVAGRRPPSSQLCCMAAIAATPPATSPTKFSHPAPSLRRQARARGP